MLTEASDTLRGMLMFNAGQVEGTKHSNPQADDPLLILEYLPTRQKEKAPGFSVRRFKFGGACGGRTHDKRIKSPLLYQLS